MKAISVQAVSKEFRLQMHRAQFRNLKDWLYPSRRRPVREERFQALKDVSFEVEQGQVLGLIGKNGAGKSTLLKILSRIIRPTSGRIELNGRVGSLLEVGAGFHDDLTGRENVFLNAAILGMSYREAASKLDQIVAFAGVERMLDEPVKHYSSGMYMRLAFAVAAHIEPEILLVDEVLAVGDAEFQKKCIERIEEVGRHGQTVILVSHNAQTVLRLCDRAVCLGQGRVLAEGPAVEVIARYQDLGGNNLGERRYGEGPYAPGDSVVRLRAARARDRMGRVLRNVNVSEEVGLEIEFDVLTDDVVLFPILTVGTDRAPILWATDTGSRFHGQPRPTGRYRQTAWIPAHTLGNGTFRVGVMMDSTRPQHRHLEESDVIVFQATDNRGGARGDYTGQINEGMRPLLEWTAEHEPATADRLMQPN